MTKVHRIAGLRISRVTPSAMAAGADDGAHGRELLPDLEPAEDRLRRQKSLIFRSDSISVALSHNSAMEDVFDPELREEHRNLTARVTVYVMNLTIMVLALPVGLVLALVLTYVINLRSFGWTLALDLQPGPFVQAFAVAILAALVGR